MSDRCALIELIEELAPAFELAAPEEIIRWAFDQFGDRIAIATGFGAEGIALIDMAAKIRPNPNVFFLDTGFLFPETYQLRCRIESRYGIQIRAFSPQLSPQEQERRYGPKLWEHDPDLCCKLRKLEPLKEALNGLDAWMTAIRRDQTPTRRAARPIEWDPRWKLVKVNPLVNWTRRDVWRYIIRNELPYNPLHDRGYPSIGCIYCTRPVGPGEDERAGRWPGHPKTECGLHETSELGG
jgi:phosphoadenosine phosphosulfate reductase